MLRNELNSLNRDPLGDVDAVGAVAECCRGEGVCVDCVGAGAATVAAGGAELMTPNWLAIGVGMGSTGRGAGLGAGATPSDLRRRNPSGIVTAWIVSLKIWT